MQVGFLLAFQREVIAQVLGADHVLERRFTVRLEAEYDERLNEDRVRSIEGENLQRHVGPVSFPLEPAKLLVHHALIANPTLQDRLIDKYRKIQSRFAI